MDSMLQSVRRWTRWALTTPKALAGACGMATVVGVTTYVARGPRSPARAAGAAALRLSAPAAPVPAPDVPAAPPSQAGSGLGVVAYETDGASTPKPPPVRTGRLSEAVADTQASSQAHDGPPSDEADAAEPQADGPSLVTASGPGPQPLADQERLNPRALGGDDLAPGARLASTSQASQPAPMEAAKPARHAQPLGEEGAAASVPHGQPEFRRLAAANGPPAGGAAPSGRRYGSADQAQDFTKAGGIAAGRSVGAAGAGHPSESDAPPAAAGGGQQPAIPNVGTGEDPTAPAATEYRYGPYALNTLDFYQGAKSPAPLVVFFHGGGFYRGDKKDARDYLSILKRGYAMASCNYRLIHDPSQLGGVALAAYDARNAVRWLKDNAARLGVDRDRVVAVGASAGGYLSAMLGSAGDVGLADGAASGTSPRVQAVVDLAGPTDFGGAVIAPMQFADEGDPPTFIRHGRDDPIVSYTNSTRYAAKLQSVGVRVDLKIYDGLGHEIPPAFREQLITESMDFADSVLH